MSEEKFSRMYELYKDLFTSKIEPMLESYNSNRKKELFKLSFAIFTHVVVVICFGSIVLSCFIPFVGIIGVFLGIPLLFVCAILYRIFIPEEYAQNNQEIKLKIPFMKECMSIFLDNVLWTQYSPENLNKNIPIRNKYLFTIGKSEYNDIKSSWGKLKEIKSQNIIPKFLIALFDDIMFGKYKDVNIGIYETNTNLIQAKLFLPILLTCIFILFFCYMFFSLLCVLFGLVVTIFLAESTMTTWPLWTILIITVILLTFIIPLAIFVKAFHYAVKHKFKGIIVEFDMNKNFNGHTFFHDTSVNKKGFSLKKNTYEEVKLELSDFTNKYKVYSDDQVEARYLITPALMERVSNLKFAFKAKYVNGSFKNNKLTLAIYTGKDMFAMGNDFKDTNEQTFEELYEEMISILQIVDELKLNEHTGL